MGWSGCGRYRETVLCRKTMPVNLGKLETSGQIPSWRNHRFENPFLSLSKTTRVKTAVEPWDLLRSGKYTSGSSTRNVQNTKRQLDRSKGNAPSGSSHGPNAKNVVPRLLESFRPLLFARRYESADRSPPLLSPPLPFPPQRKEETLEERPRANKPTVVSARSGGAQANEVPENVINRSGSRYSLYGNSNFAFGGFRRPSSCRCGAGEGGRGGSPLQLVTVRFPSRGFTITNVALDEDPGTTLQTFESKI